MGQFNRQSNEEREYDRFREEASEELAERGFDEQEAGKEEHRYKSSVDWYELPETIELHIEPTKLRDLMEEAWEKAGSGHALYRETGMSENAIYYVMSGEREVIEIGTLKKLLDYLEIPYNEMDQYIIGIGGGGDQIRGPKLPFDFNSEEGAIVIAAALKDGCLFKGNYVGFLYANKDEENIDRVKRAGKRSLGK